MTRKRSLLRAALVLALGVAMFANPISALHCTPRQPPEELICPPGTVLVPGKPCRNTCDYYTPDYCKPTEGPCIPTETSLTEVNEAQLSRTGNPNRPRVRPDCELINSNSTSWCNLTPGKGGARVAPAEFQAVLNDNRVIINVANTGNIGNADPGSEPDTSFACIYYAEAATDKRLQRTQCSRIGGTWYPVDGGRITIDISDMDPGQYYIQVAANPRAKNSNGDAFYNTFGLRIGGDCPTVTPTQPPIDCSLAANCGTRPGNGCGADDQVIPGTCYRDANSNMCKWTDDLCIPPVTCNPNSCGEYNPTKECGPGFKPKCGECKRDAATNTCKYTETCVPVPVTCSPNSCGSIDTAPTPCSRCTKDEATNTCKWKLKQCPTPAPCVPSRTSLTSVLLSDSGSRGRGRPECEAINATATEWCGLTPGKGGATVTPQEAQGILSSSGNTLTITVRNTDPATNRGPNRGAEPRTTFACIYEAEEATDKRLQRTQCDHMDGIWLPVDGPVNSINLSSLNLKADTQYFVQVAANGKANNSNGDAFYNTFGLKTGNTC